MPAWKIDINVNPKEKQPPRASFSPTPLQATAGDSISWANNDNEQPHWPAPLVNGVPVQTGWLSEGIPPNAPSKQTLSISPSQPKGDLKYCCWYHQTELGTITVV